MFGRLYDIVTILFFVGHEPRLVSSGEERLSLLSADRRGGRMGLNMKIIKLSKLVLFFYKKKRYLGTIPQSLGWFQPILMSAEHERREGGYQILLCLADA